jgi:hypothetical protein
MGEDYREPDVPRDGVPVRVREALELSRRRDICFELAWSYALHTVDESGWPAALEETRDAWRSAYERRPASGAELALRFCREGRGVEVSGPPCQVCGDEAATARSTYCSPCYQARERARHGVAA